MPARRRTRRSWPLFKFDQLFRERYGLIAGVDEAGRGPLAGPVVAAAVILPPNSRIPGLNDSKALSSERRNELYRRLQRAAWAIGVGIVDHEEIDRINIYQAAMAAMRQALARLIFRPAHVLVDGFPIPGAAFSQTGIIGGDAKSASIAAASIIAKVTRDCLMECLDRQYPEYGFRRHKGYGTAAHLAELIRCGPCPIHRRSFMPVRELELPFPAETGCP